MATENKRLNTRILLKYDTYANWTTNNPVLLAGEVAIATVETESTTHATGFQNLPNVVMKVGDGSSHYNDLKFVSGLAADVHSWAKAANKPGYAITEIEGAKEYQVVKKVAADGSTSEYAWELQARKAGSEETWVKVSDIDFTAISARIKAVEDEVDDHETRIGALETTVGDKDSGLVKKVAALELAVGTGGAVETAIANAIDALDTPEEGVGQEAGADGLALDIVQENGIVKSISGSIAAGTYDKFGAAAAVEGKLTEYQTSNDAAVKDAADAAAAAQDDIDQEILDRKAAIEALKMTAAVEGTQEGTTIKFIDKISQANGIVSAELGELVFNSEYDAKDNKAATMSDITNTMANLNGAMRFKGVKESIPTDNTGYIGGDVIIVGIKEYVFDGTNWIELGDEGAIAATINALEATVSIEDKNDSNPLNITVVQESGVLKSVTGSIDDVFDAKGTAQGLIDDLNATVSIEDTDDKNPLNITIKETNGKLVSVTGSIDDVFDAKGTADATVKALNLDEVAGTQAGTAIKFINKVSQSSGVVSAEVGTILVNTAYNADNNKIATMADITKAEGEVGKEVEDLEKRVAANEEAIDLLNDGEAVVGSVANSIKTQIDALTSDSTGEGPVVTGVTQTNGVVSVTRGTIDIKDVAQTAETYVVFDCGSSSKNI